MLKETLLFLGLLAFVLLSFMLLNTHWGAFSALDSALAQFSEVSPWLIAVVVLALCLDVLIPVPSTVVLVLLGLWLGPIWGGALGFAALMISTALGYYLGRAGRLGLDRNAPRLFGEMRDREGGPLSFALIAVTRAVPMLSEAMTIHAGLTRLPPMGFFLSATAGTLPFAFLYASAVHLSTQSALSFPAWLCAALLPGALVLFIGWARSYRQPTA